MQDEEDAVREGVRALTQFFVDEGTLGDTLHRVSELACAITPATYAGITMIVEGRPSTGVFTHADAPEISGSTGSSRRPTTRGGPISPRLPPRTASPRPSRCLWPLAGAHWAH